MKKAISYFKEISKYPRPSKDEGRIRDYLISWAEGYNFENTVDENGNLLIKIPAKNSGEKVPVILQSHMDMVCVKGKNSKHDFLLDPIDIIEKDGFLYANNTTLGADNGIGMALSMATTHFEKYPPLELLFTIDEEQGMSGALGLKKGFLTGTKLINLDSDNEQEICISSAGGKSLYLGKELFFKESSSKKYKLVISGLKGGHSGVEIDKNHGNAIDLFTKFLNTNYNIKKIYNINSGIAENVIPSTIEVIFAVDDLDNLKISLTNYVTDFKQKFDCPDLSFEIEDSDFEGDEIIGLTDLLRQIAKIDVGVYKMSNNIDGLVETSMNLGIIKIEDSKIKFVYSIRSSKNDELERLVKSTEAYYKGLGFDINIAGGYPGWQDNPKGELVTLVKNEMMKVIGKEPRLFAIHAGLECGAIVSKLGEGASAISIGPNAYDIHSVNERVEIASVERFERILESVLERLA